MRFHVLPRASMRFQVLPRASTWFHALPRASSRVSHTWSASLGFQSLTDRAMEDLGFDWLKSVQIFSLIWSGFVAFLFLAYLHICNFRDLCSAIIRNNYYNFRWKSVRRMEWVRHHGGVKDQWVPHAQTRTRQWQAVSCWTFIVSSRGWGGNDVTETYQSVKQYTHAHRSRQILLKPRDHHLKVP